MALIESILVIIVVVIILVILYNIFFTKSNLLITGLVPANITTIIDKSRLPSNISSNFAWSIWFFINDWNVNYGSSKIVFYQATDKNTFSNSNIIVKLDSYENNLGIEMRTFDTTGGDTSFVNNYIIPNIEIQKWVNLIISVEGRTLDIYLHGKLVRTFVLPNTADLMPQNVYVGDTDNYFDGNMGRLQYFANSLNPQQAYNIYKDGISSNLISDFFNKYRLKLQFMEYNSNVGNPIIL